jgi:tRNA 5-methylaminomethyl-2-thiouridine biosynthesis bifunctional protein
LFSDIILPIMASIVETRISFRDERTPVSDTFGDIYFSSEDGIAESTAVYLEGAHVRAAIDRGDPVIRVGELGFGVGLNFLLTWRYFLEHSAPHQRLHYTAVEGFPVHKDDLIQLFSHYPELSPQTDILIKNYPWPIPGIHRRSLSDSRVTLLLVWDKLPNALRILEGKVAHWYWDGFSPKANPEAFSTEVFAEVARLSTPGSHGSSFTCAGWVRRALQENGFQVSKVPGFGKKRERIHGLFQSAVPKEVTETKASPHISAPENITIVGAGLAGAIAARVFAEAGTKVTVLEKDAPGDKASGNPAGLFNWQVSAVPSPVSRIHLNALLLQNAMLNTHAWLKDALIQKGILKILQSEEEIKRTKLAMASHGLAQAFASIKNPEEASALAGIPLEHPALHLPECGLLSPLQLIHAALDHPNITLSKTDQIPAPEPHCPVIFATGANYKSIPILGELPLQVLPGQISLLKPTAESEALRATLIHHGYVSPKLPSGLQMIGATYRTRPSAFNQDELDSATLIREAHARAAAFQSWTVEDVQAVRVSNRLASPDKTPLLGRWEENLYVSLAHGSRGVTTAFLSAFFLLDQMRGDPLPLDRDLLKYLDPHRFDRRLRNASERRSLSTGPKNNKKPE